MSSKKFSTGEGIDLYGGMAYTTIMSKLKTFEDFLQDKFMDTREFCGRAITKDNCEDLFCAWLEDLDPQEFIDFGEQAIQLARIEGKEEILKNFEPHIKALDTEIFATHIDKDELKGGADYPPIKDEQQYE